MVDSKKHSVKTGASYLGVSPQKIHKMINNREIEFFRVGSRIVITQEALDDYIEKNKVKPIDAKAIAREILKR